MDDILAQQESATGDVQNLIGVELLPHLITIQPLQKNSAGQQLKCSFILPFLKHVIFLIHTPVEKHAKKCGH